ncbi:MAG: J domain-containing protein [Sumerlaeia bacterium]
MARKPTYYEVLQVAPDADREVILAAYRTLQKKHHPDSGGSEEMARLLNEAKGILLDPARRRAYDEYLTSRNRPRPAAASGQDWEEGSGRLPRVIHNHEAEEEDGAEPIVWILVGLVGGLIGVALLAYATTVN